MLLNSGNPPVKFVLVGKKEAWPLVVKAVATHTFALNITAIAFQALLIGNPVTVLMVPSNFAAPFTAGFLRCRSDTQAGCR